MARGITKSLLALLQGQPSLARPFVEILETKNQDQKRSLAEFTGADDTSGFTLRAQGGCTLKDAAQVLFVHNPATADEEDVNEGSPSGGVMLTAMCEFSVFINVGIFQARAFIDTAGNVGAGNGRVMGQLFEVLSSEQDPLEDQAIWNVRAMSDPTECDESPLGDNFLDFVTFNFVQPGEGDLGFPATPTGGDQFDDERPETPTCVLFVWTLDETGTNRVEWLQGADGEVVVSGHTLRGFDLEKINANDRYAVLGPVVGVPKWEISGRNFTEDIIEWIVNPLDLGVAPAANTEIRLTVGKIEPGNSEIRSKVSDDGGVSFTTFVNGDVIGEDNTPDGGSDLSALTRQQVYEVQATLIPDTAQGTSPTLVFIAVAEIEQQLVSAEVEVTAMDFGIDPIECIAEIGTASIVLRRDGVKDYRSFAEEIIANNPLLNLIVRIHIGHPSIPLGDFMLPAWRRRRRGAWS